MSGCQVFFKERIPECWECEPIGERIAFKYGVGLKEENRLPGKVCVYGSNGIVAYHNQAFLQGPGILVGRKGTVGAVHYTEKTFWPIDTVYYIELLKDDSLRFIYYLLDYLNLGKLNAATGVPGLSRRDALAIRGAFPPRDQQDEIAQILDAVDVAMNRTRTEIDLSRRLREGLLRALLTQGVGLDGLIRDKKADPDKFKNSKVGWVPEDWSISSVEQEFEIATGFTLNENRRPKVNKRQYLRVANVQRNRILLDDIAELEATDAEMNGKRLEEDDLLIVEGHADPYAIGRCARVTPEAVGLTFQNHLYRLRSRVINPQFACIWLNSQWVRRYWQRMCATSSGLNTINQRKLKALPIVLPPSSEQKIITEIANSQNAFIDSLQECLSKIINLKRGLMQDLLTDKVRVNQPQAGVQAKGQMNLPFMTARG